jgi:prepilin-type N-terminal cleavage/methylation domain-containing protein/prepilin-type processing-associated H-X9-DG protein
MILTRKQSAFTLVELLVTIVIISLLSAIVMPSIGKARDMANDVTCTSNLRGLGQAAGLYPSDNRDNYWPCRSVNTPAPGKVTYFWGSATDPVDPSASPFLKAYSGSLSTLWCPRMEWGDYVPQGNVSEPTTTYGYNAWCLDPPAWGRRTASGAPMPRKKRSDINDPSNLFVFADAAMYWAPGGVGVLQNSTHLEPVSGTWQQTPTTHFRHDGMTNALTADGSVDAYGPEGWKIAPAYKDVNLGFVGTSNIPHYDQ